MNSIRTITLKLLRSYATKYPSETIGISGKIKLKKIEQSEINLDEFVEDDLDECESDFMDVGKSYKTYQREMERNKDVLRARIVRNKYFKDVQPNFLTFVERDQIQRLHKSDPEEWTPERLSESFPALPESISKILTSKFVPRSVEEAIKYDTKVIENWKMFKTGKLVVDPALNDHLMKFRHRKISLTDRESLVENLIPPKMEFPKPRSVMFSNMIKDFVDVEQTSHNQQQISDGSNRGSDKKKLITVEKENIKMPIVRANESTNAKNNNQKNNKVREKLVINESMKTSHNQQQISDGSNRGSDKKKLITIEKENIKMPIVRANESTNAKNNNQKNNKVREKLVINESMKTKINELYKTSPEKLIAFLKMKQEHMKSSKLEDVSSNTLQDTTEGESKGEENVHVVEASKETLSKAEDREFSSLDTVLNDAMKTASIDNKSTVIIKPLTQTHKHSSVISYNQKCYETNRKLTFDEFMKVNLNNMSDTSPEEEITLTETYREHIESVNAEDVSSNILNDTTKGLSKEEKNVEVAETSSDKCSLIIKQNEPRSKAIVAATADHGSLDTYVKEWNTSIDKEFKYAMSIKIPKNVYKKGMTYKVVDCYYDDDGEFLYRTPGLRN